MMGTRDRRPGASKAQGIVTRERPRIGEEGRPRGVVLVVCLLLGVVLLFMAYGMFAMQSRGYAEARMRRQSLQADQVARAGIDAALVRLGKDPTFPPRMGGRSTFSFTDSLIDPVSGQTVGSCFVTIDLSRRELAVDADPGRSESYDYPHMTVRIRSEGTVRDDLGHLAAVRRIDAELDMSPKARRQPVSHAARYTNPNLFRFLRWEDAGAI